MRNFVIVLSLFATGAFAQPVWRCGNTYGSQPCEGGTVVPAAPPVNSVEVARARAVGKADAQLAAALEQARLKQEKAAPRAVVPLPPASASAPVKKAAPSEKKKKEPEHLTAVGPAPRKK